MFEKLTAIETRYDELMQGITNLSAESDSAQYRKHAKALADIQPLVCLLYTSPSPRDLSTSRMPSSA